MVCRTSTLGCPMPMPSLLCSLCHVHAVISEYKQCTEMSGGVKRPLSRGDSCTKYCTCYSFKSTLATDGTITSAAVLHNDCCNTVPYFHLSEGLSPYFKTFMEPRNRLQGMNSASLCSLAGRYDNPIPSPIDRLKIPALN
jgi:hypothetical protein